MNTEIKKVVEEHERVVKSRCLVLENHDLIREITKFIEPILPFILSSKTTRAALTPKLEQEDDKNKWILSMKKDFLKTAQMLKFAYECGCPGCPIYYFRDAAAIGSVEALKWARRTFLPIEFRNAIKDICNIALQNGHLQVLKYVRSCNSPFIWNRESYYETARFGYLHVLKWLREKDPDFPWDSNICAYAAMGGHIAVLEWLQSQEPKCPIDSLSCSYAARHGQLETLRWLRALSTPCPWDAFTCSDAARGGHMKVLQWLRWQRPPCAWDARVCLEAARGGFLEILQWLRAGERPCPWSVVSCLEVARENRCFEVVEWILLQE